MFWNLWAGRLIKSMLSNLLFNSGTFNTTSLRFIQSTRSPSWRGETLAGQLQLLNICSCEWSLAFPPALSHSSYSPPALMWSCLFNTTMLSLVYSFQYCKWSFSNMTPLQWKAWYPSKCSNTWTLTSAIRHPSWDVKVVTVLWTSVALPVSNMVLLS